MRDVKAAAGVTPRNTRASQPFSMLYFAFIERHPDRRYSVTLPDFPGCVTHAGTLAGIEAAAQQAVTVHLADCPAPLGEPLRSDLLPPAFDTREGYWMLVDLAPAVGSRTPARTH